MRILVISPDALDAWKHVTGSDLEYYQLTDEQFKDINERYERGWSFDSLEEFAAAFNCDDNTCPVPSTHYIRFVKDDPSPGEVIRQAISSLKALRTSGYVPYASPAPCTTEVVLKRELDAAIFRLDNAEAVHESLYHDRNRG